MAPSLLSAASLLFLAGLYLPQSREQGPPVPAPIQGPTIKAESRIVVEDVVVTTNKDNPFPASARTTFTSPRTAARRNALGRNPTFLLPASQSRVGRATRDLLS